MLYATDTFGRPLSTTTGIRCGNHHPEDRIRHTNAAAVAECYRLMYDDYDQQYADLRAELAIERYLENRGYDDARAQEAYERSMGVIPFDVAYAEAMRNH